MIAEATGFAETDNEEILAARKMFSEAEAKHKEALAPEAEKVRQARRPVHPGHRAPRVPPH